MGEAMITALDEKGRPTPLAATLLRSPMSRMDILTPAEINTVLAASKLVPFYNREVDRESAYEILGKKMESAVAGQQSADKNRQGDKGKRGQGEEGQVPDILKELSKNTMARQMGRTLMRELTRGLFGMLSGKRR
jgi:hypothetical protein